MESISVQSVSKEYAKGFFALRDLTFSVKEGNFVSIVGPFGCGKTTLLNLLSGITEEYYGTINRTGKTPVEARRTRKIGYVFQKPALLPWRNVIRNVILPLEIAGMKNGKERALDLLRMTKIDRFIEKKPDELSGGMQQLVSIVRSLVLDPDVLLLDEPFSSIDEINKTKLHNELLKIHRETNKTTIMVTHCLEEAVYLSNQIIVLTPNPGRVKAIIEIDLSNEDRLGTLSEKFVAYLKIIKKELERA